MSTIALISIQQKDKIQSVYCNNDGYIEHCGMILNKHYNSFNKAKELISLGSLFCLGPEIGKAHNIDLPFEHQFWHPNYDKQKSIPKTWSKFYYRDDVKLLSTKKKWEKKHNEYKDLTIDNFIINTKNEEELFETYNLESGVEYIYLFKDNSIGGGYPNWFVKNNNVDTYNLLKENIKYINTV